MMNYIERHRRYERIMAMREKHSYAEIGRRLGVSGQRVLQIIQDGPPTVTRVDNNLPLADRQRRYEKIRQLRQKHTIPEVAAIMGIKPSQIVWLMRHKPKKRGRPTKRSLDNLGRTD